MFDFFKNAASDLQAAASKFRDKEAAEAVVAIMVGVANADGEFEPEEKKKNAFHRGRGARSAAQDAGVGRRICCG